MGFDARYPAADGMNQPLSQPASVADGFDAAIMEALDALRPAMETDGGGVELVEINGDQVVLRLIGSCIFCPSRALSASALQRRLSERVPQISSVLVLPVSLPVESSR